MSIFRMYDIDDNQNISYIRNVSKWRCEVPRKNDTLFQIGDRVKLRVGNGAGLTYTVSWVSKGATTPKDQLIATECNGYCHTASWASLYEKVEA